MFIAFVVKKIFIAKDLTLSSWNSCVHIYFQMFYLFSNEF